MLIEGCLVSIPHNERKSRGRGIFFFSQRYELGILLIAVFVSHLPHLHRMCSLGHLWGVLAVGKRRRLWFEGSPGAEGSVAVVHWQLVVREEGAGKRPPLLEKVKLKCVSMGMWCACFVGVCCVQRGMEWGGGKRERKGGDKTCASLK